MHRPKSGGSDIVLPLVVTADIAERTHTLQQCNVANLRTIEYCSKKTMKRFTDIAQQLLHWSCRHRQGRRTAYAAAEARGHGL